MKYETAMYTQLQWEKVYCGYIRDFRRPVHKQFQLSSLFCSVITSHGEQMHPSHMQKVKALVERDYSCRLNLVRCVVNATKNYTKFQTMELLSDLTTFTHNSLTSTIPLQLFLRGLPAVTHL